MQRRSLWNNLLDRGPMLTPLIDIIFLVLIFFMVNNSPTQRKLRVEPPAMPNAPEYLGEPQSILLLAVRPDLSYVIQLQNDSRILQEWRGEAVASQVAENPQDSPKGIPKGAFLQALEQQLETLASSQQIVAQISRIRLRADQSLDYGSVIAICNLLYRWGLPLDLDVS